MKRFGARLFGSSRWKLAVLAALVVAALGAAAFWSYTAFNQAGAEGVRYRWANVSIEVPPRAGPGDIAVVRDEGLPDIYSPSPGTRVPGLRIFKQVVVGDHIEGSDVYVDATTGQVVYEDVLPEHRAEFEAVLATLRLEDPEPADVWPYGGSPPEERRRQAGNISYIEPDPASGVAVRGGIADGAGRSAVFLVVSNGRSKRYIDGETGQVIVKEGGELLGQVHERDREAFERFTSSIEVLAE